MQHILVFVWHCWSFQNSWIRSSYFSPHQKSYNCSAFFGNLLWPVFRRYNSHSMQKGAHSIYLKYLCLNFLMANLVLAQFELYIVVLFPDFARKILQDWCCCYSQCPKQTNWILVSWTVNCFNLWSQMLNTTNPTVCWRQHCRLPPSPRQKWWT